MAASAAVRSCGPRAADYPDAPATDGDGRVTATNVLATTNSATNRALPAARDRHAPRRDRFPLRAGIR